MVISPKFSFRLSAQRVNQTFTPGLDANIAHWVANYITSRLQKVAVNGTIPLTVQLYYLECHWDLY